MLQQKAVYSLRRINTMANSTSLSQLPLAASAVQLFAGDMGASLATAATDADWLALNQRLRNSGFAGIRLQHQPQVSSSLSPQRHAKSQQAKHASTSIPEANALYMAFDGLLTQYDRRAHLVQELLAATDLARERESRIDAVLNRLQR